MRDEKIDILRFIGLAMIVLAHSGLAPSELLFQIRNFDVPLMVLVSGMSFALSYKGQPRALYVWKRIKRLLFPVWLFLTGYFFVMYATGYPMPLPSKNAIVTSYMLLSGIGYVWVIRVFLLVAITAPSILRFSRRLKSFPRYMTVLGFFYVLYELAVYFSKPPLTSALGVAIENTVLYLVPYAVLFAIGLRVQKLTRRQLLCLAGGSSAVFCLKGISLYHAYGKFIPTQVFKYPPTVYYLSYALTVSLILWCLSPVISKVLTKTRLLGPVMFVAQNSIWVYLWHILLIQVVKLEYAYKFPVVFALASCVVFFQVQILRKLILPRIESLSVRSNLNALLTG